MLGTMLGHKPGDTIDVAGRSPAYISFVYTHSYPEEFPIVMDRAEAVLPAPPRPDQGASLRPRVKNYREVVSEDQPENLLRLLVNRSEYV